MIGEAGWGAAKSAVTGGIAKVFTHAQVFAKIPVNRFTENMASKVASKAASKKGLDRLVPSIIQKPAQKAASFISTRKRFRE